jgi:hypothetical protein
MLRADFEYGVFLIVIEGEIGNLKVSVWDTQIQPPDQQRKGRVVCEKYNLQSINFAKDAAAECIATDTNNDARAIRLGIRPYKLGHK